MVIDLGAITIAEYYGEVVSFWGLMTYAANTVPHFAFCNPDKMTGKSITSIILPSSATAIGQNAFNLCKSLTSISIPPSITFIDEAAFQACTGLLSIYVYPSSPVGLIASYAHNVFLAMNKTTCILYVPMGSKSAYQAADQWKDFTHIEEFNAVGSTLIEASAYSLYPNPTSNGFSVNVENDARVDVYTMDGTAVLSISVIGNTSIATSNLAAGFYLVKVWTDKGVWSGKLIVE